jgi:hypothetical protein
MLRNLTNDYFYFRFVSLSIGIFCLRIDDFELSDEFAQIRGLLAMGAKLRAFNCEADAGRTPFLRG